MDLTTEDNREAFVIRHREMGWTFPKITAAYNAQVPEEYRRTKQMIGLIYKRVHGASRLTPMQRFMQSWMPVTESGCWIWMKKLNMDGYGTFGTGEGAETMPAHRWAYEQFVGPVPAELTMDHLCRVRCCVNPAHLEPVTPRENVLRGIGPAARRAKQTHCLRGHELAGENLYLYKAGRHCRTCMRVYQERYRKGRAA